MGDNHTGIEDILPQRHSDTKPLLIAVAIVALLGSGIAALIISGTRDKNSAASAPPLKEQTEQWQKASLGGTPYENLEVLCFGSESDEKCYLKYFTAENDTIDSVIEAYRGLFSPTVPGWALMERDARSLYEEAYGDVAIEPGSEILLLLPLGQEAENSRNTASPSAP